jgi:hypothetical protein
VEADIEPDSISVQNEKQREVQQDFIFADHRSEFELLEQYANKPGTAIETEQ